MATTNAIEIGQRIGRAIARDVLADCDCTLPWTGLSDQDEEQIFAAGIVQGTEKWYIVAQAARQEYEKLTADARPRILTAPLHGAELVVAHTANGRQIRLRDGKLWVQPHNDNYWLECDSIEQAYRRYEDPHSD